MEWIYNVAMTYEGDECLVWPHGQDGNGRGSVVFDGKTTRAHRVVCELAYGRPEDDSLNALHSCGNGHLGCVTKRHLRWGTQLDNVADSIAHGTFARGEDSGNAKLIEVDVQMNRFLADKGFPQTRIAKKFGVSAGQIGKIVHRLKWAWLDDQSARAMGSTSSGGDDG